ncbi:MAG: helix-turn-helix domain-containing protein [Luteolibacter sp.]
MELADGKEYCLELLALENGYSVSNVSLALGCSHRYLHVTFMRDIGLSPKRWMRYERMVLARRKLEGGLSPEEVADHLGFAGLHSFRREFQGFHHVSPVKFQRDRQVFDPKLMGNPDG